MKFFKIFLIIIILILPANANTIYNLIKIPNLEIYKHKTQNGIKYLKAVKPFQVGFRNDNVTCLNADNKSIKKKFSLIENNLAKYEAAFLNKINLKYIVLCKNLSVSGIDAAGVPNSKMKTLIIDINFKKDYFERVIHHEIFHIINDSYKNYFSEKEWNNFNPKKFKYAECSTCTDRVDLAAIENTKGFLTEYSMTTASEDMAEVFSFIMYYKNIDVKSSNDPILKKKISFIKKNVMRINNNFAFE